MHDLAGAACRRQIAENFSNIQTGPITSQTSHGSSATLVRLPCGSCDVRNLIVGKENRSIRTAAARQPCGRRVISQNCRKEIAKHSCDTRGMQGCRAKALRCLCVHRAFIVRSSYEFDPRGGYKCKDRGKHQAYIHHILTEAHLFVMAIIPQRVAILRRMLRDEEEHHNSILALLIRERQRQRRQQRRWWVKPWIERRAQK